MIRDDLIRGQGRKREVETKSGHNLPVTSVHSISTVFYTCFVRNNLYVKLKQMENL